MSAEQKAEIENNIEATKAKIREKIGEQKQSKYAGLRPAPQMTEYKKRIEATTRGVEMTLDEIQPDLRNPSAMVKSLSVAGKVTDFKFTNDEKSKAYAKL